MDKKVVIGISVAVVAIVIACVIAFMSLQPKEEATEQTSQSSSTTQTQTNAQTQTVQTDLPTLSECNATSTPYMYDFLYGTLAWHDKNIPVPTSNNGVKLFCAAQNNKTKELYFQFSTSPQRLIQGWNVYAPYTTGIKQSTVLITQEEFDKMEQKAPVPTLEQAYSELGTDDYVVEENGWSFTFAWITPTETKGKYWSDDHESYYQVLSDASATTVLENQSGKEFNDGKGINKDYTNDRLVDIIKQDTNIDVTTLDWYKNHNLGETVTLYCDKNTKVDSMSLMDLMDNGMPVSSSKNNYIAKFEEYHNNGEVSVTMQPGALVQTSGNYYDVFGNTCAYNGETLYSLGSDMGYITQDMLKEVCGMYGFDTSSIF